MSVKSATNEDVASMTFNSPIKISDVRSMFTKKIEKNTRPFDRSVMEANNRYVEEWYETVLVPLSKGGSLPAGQVTSLFQTFLEGKEIAQYIKFKERVNGVPEETVLYWANLLYNSSVEDLHRMGPALVRQAADMVFTSIKRYFAEKKWEMIYSKSTNPLDWVKIANEHPHLMNGRPMPFGLSDEMLKDIQEKIRPVMTIVPSPDN